MPRLVAVAMGLAGFTPLVAGRAEVRGHIGLQEALEGALHELPQEVRVRQRNRLEDFRQMEKI